MADSSVTTAAYTFAPAGTGTGLTGDYYTGTNFNALSFSRIDPFIDFAIWDPDTFAPGYPYDNFSIRWTGKVLPQFTETYTFYMLADDGVRLWINGQLIIDKWIDQAPTEYSADVALVAGQQADVKIEYYEKIIGARCRFAWSSPSLPKQTVPQIRLYPAGSVVAKAASSLLQSLVDGALPGETVDLGPGTHVVAGGLFIPAGVSVKGAGPGRTILEGGVRLLGGSADGPTTVEGLTVQGGLHAGSAGAVLRHLVVVGSAGDGIAGDPGGVVTAIHVTVADNAGRAIAVAGGLSLRNSIVSGGISAGSGVTVTASSVDEPVSFLADYRAAPGSSTIDAGDPADPFDAEPAPNGGRVNQGAFGNTPDAEPTSAALKAASGPGASSRPDGGCGATGMEVLLLLAILAAQRRSR
jgi:hypothetical protein